ncbi:dipeptidyl aminopeptidase/acylaminoacyl peptidase [Thermosporothrix hazakensis]|jgi:dipeptidyl aminopeptidase/acylaminoacyl peptidase|uniref:Acyl-peptide hydrolase n=1 Tax=Thermosporothrix hazakensis TaxID=644383 RepID=A0A326UBA5_THEHA|nr:S9 family peptidase [Thermosporothrix hazakensis]PZW35862.1 dipeptidyl aminopeptidase/acylaminoacyl peptidase [Thermosporothrix hazakensis]GCE46514.1 peptidase S9 [Thermosporothrix hazakensis]
MVKRTYEFERYMNVRSAMLPSFSPDGSQMAFLTDITGVHEVWSVAVEKQAKRPAWPEQLTFRNERMMEAVFSPVANTLIAVGDMGGNERTQLYLLHADGSVLKGLTEKPEVMHHFGAWSPDGRRIVYSSNERDQRYFDIYEMGIASGAVRLLYQQDGSNYACQYSPDGRSVLISRSLTTTQNQLLLLDTVTNEVRELTPAIQEGPAWHGAASWTADRKGLYLLSDRGREFMSLAYLDLETTEMTFLYELSWDIEQLALTEDGSVLALSINEDGCSRLELYDVTQGWDERKQLIAPTLPKGVVLSLGWSKEGNELAITLSAADDTTDIWVWHLDGGTVQRMTYSSTGGIPRDTFVSPQLLRYPSFDERQIPAFLYLPEGKHENLPVIISVHGGPESQERPRFNWLYQYLVACGYAVLAPNVRGSTGYGYEYQSLDDVRKRMDSVADLKYAVNWLCEQGIADPKRIAVMGGSYGGFMVLAALTTYPELWAAGVDIVGIANLVTFLENTGPWRRKLRESEYGSLEHDREFLEQISPINHVEKIVAPLFVIHGANDPRVPVGETEQIVKALQERNVPVECLIFADEGHGIVKRANRLQAYPAVVRFLDQHLRGEHR